MNAAAIIVAAGTGQRFGGGAPKQFRLLGGAPVLRWSLKAMNADARVQRIAVVCEPERAEAVLAMAKGLSTPVLTVNGGATRTASVRNGLAALAATPPDVLLIHDAARPGLTADMLDRLFEALDAHDAAAPALPITDALKAAAGEGLGEPVDREALMAVQTPQAFRWAALERAYSILPDGESLADDIAVAQAAGVKTVWVAGDRRNEKITYPEDLERMEALLSGPGLTVTGQGFDVHRLISGDGVWLCGVKIPCDRALEGHSDADAGLHAVCDAMLGTIGAGDIGLHFPPSDPQWKDAASDRFVTHCLSLMTQAGAAPLHCDVTLICETPKIGPHREAMRDRLAALLGLPSERVNVKATTTERLGALGRSEGIAAQAVLTARIAS